MYLSLTINGRETHLLKEDLAKIVAITEINKDKDTEDLVIMIISLYIAYAKKGLFEA